MKFIVELTETRTASVVVEVESRYALDRAIRKTGNGLIELLNSVPESRAEVRGTVVCPLSDNADAPLHVDAGGALAFAPSSKALQVPEQQKAPAPTPTVDIALLIWQRNRVAELVADSPDRLTCDIQDAWDGIVNLIDSVIDEAHPPGTPPPPPYRPWKESGPATTRQCFIDYIDAHGGMAMSDKLWSEYSEYCREAGVDPLIKEET